MKYVSLKMPSGITTTPLKDAELLHLKNIYNIRRRNVFTMFSVLMLMALVASFMIAGRYSRFNEKKDGEGVVDRNDMRIINFLWLETPLLVVAISVYRKRVLRYKKDLKNGVKELVPYTIISKRHFQHTGQYFFSFDDPEYMHYEVDAMVYSQHSEGDTLYVSRAPHSKYVFDEKGRFSIT